MKLKGKILSIVLSVLLCCAMLPAAGAEATPEDGVDFSLDTIIAGSVSPMMTLRASKQPDTDITLKITYDTDQATLVFADTDQGPVLAVSCGMLYRGEEPEGEDGNIQFHLNAGSFDGAAVIAFFQFALADGVNEDVVIHLEAYKADGTALKVQDGRIRPATADYSFDLAENDRIISSPDIGVSIAVQDKLTMGMIREVLTPAEGCSLIGYGPDGAQLSDSDTLRTGCMLASWKEDAIVSQGAFIMMGDLDGDGKVDASDALLALQSSVELVELSEFQWSAGDCNGSLSVDASDALTILQYSVGLIPCCVG